MKKSLTSDWLMHHGIEGQKWGVKHGPPYPLDSSQSTGEKLKKGARRSHKELRNSIKQKKKTGEALDDEERLYRNTTRATYLGGPIAGLIAGHITNKNIKKEKELADKKAEEENYNRKTVYDEKSKKFIVPDIITGGNATIKISKTVDSRCRKAIEDEAKKYDGMPTDLLKDMDLVSGNQYRTKNNDYEITTLTYIPKRWYSPYALFDVEMRKDLKTNKIKIDYVVFND